MSRKKKLLLFTCLLICLGGSQIEGCSTKRQDATQQPLEVGPTDGIPCKDPDLDMCKVNIIILQLLLYIYIYMYIYTYIKVLNLQTKSEEHCCPCLPKCCPKGHILSREQDLTNYQHGLSCQPYNDGKLPLQTVPLVKKSTDHGQRYHIP